MTFYHMVVSGFGPPSTQSGYYHFFVFRLGYSFITRWVVLKTLNYILLMIIVNKGKKIMLIYYLDYSNIFGPFVYQPFLFEVQD